MTRDITPAGLPATGLSKRLQIFDRFCLATVIETLGTMMEADVTAACGPATVAMRRGRRTVGPNAEPDRLPRRQARGRTPRGGRGVDGREVTIPGWEMGGAGGLAAISSWSPRSGLTAKATSIRWR